MATETVNITLLGTSDLHGTFVPRDYASDTENLAGSLSQIATGSKVRAEQPNLIPVDAGDTIQGNFVETFKHEAISPMMLGLNALNYDVWVMGNHEFDFGLPVLATPLKQFKGAALAGNIVWDNGNPYLPAYTIVERRGVKIGIIGMDTPMTAEFAKGTDRIKAKLHRSGAGGETGHQANRRRVDAIVLVAHMGIDNENQRPGTGVADIANANLELAAIVAGHMHVKIDKAVVNGVIITEPDKYGRALSRIDLQFERRDGKFALIDKNSYTYSIKGMTPDSAMQALYQPYHDILRANANRVVAKLSGSDLVPADEFRGIPGTRAGYRHQRAVPAGRPPLCAAGAGGRPCRSTTIAPSWTSATSRPRISPLTTNTPAARSPCISSTAKRLNATWSGPPTISISCSRAMSPTALTRRGDRPNIPPMISSTASLTPSTCANLPVRASSCLRRTARRSPTICRSAPGMNSYRMGHLTQKGGALRGNPSGAVRQQAQYGEEEGTIRHLTLRYLTEVKHGHYQACAAALEADRHGGLRTAAGDRQTAAQ